MSIKLLKDLNFADKLNGNKAITEAGKELLNKYRGYVFSNAPTCGVVNGFLAEASRYTFDNGLMSIVENVKSYINENNISWKLASACEAVSNNNSSYNYINKLGVEQVEKLLEMNEADVVSYIKAGVLKNIQYIPEFRSVCKEVYKTQITETQAPNYSVVNPISYVHIDENQAQYFNVLGKTYRISENKVEEAVCNDATFIKINKLLEGFSHSNDKLSASMKDAHGNTYTFAVSENAIELVRTGFGKPISESFENTAKLNEYCNALSKIMSVNEKLQFMNMASVVSTLFESISQIVSLDNVKLMSSNNGTTCAIIEAKDNVNLTVFRNIKYGTSSQNYDYVVEALNQVIKLTGIDLKAMYEDRINEDCQKLDPEAEEIKEQLKANKEAQFAVRKKKIAMLAEQFKNDPVKIVLLNKVAKDLAILEKCEDGKCEDGKCKCTGKEDCECEECKKKREAKKK